MGYYLKKNWKGCVLTCFLHMCAWGMQTVTALLMIQCFDMVLSLHLEKFFFWMAVNLAAWGIYIGFGMLQGYVQARTVRTLNNQVRHDLCLSLLNKSYTDYHSQDTGEYLSYLTNHVKEIDRLAWTPFFECVGRASQVIWSIIALAALHWALLAAAIFFAGLMWLVPKLFEKRMEQLGQDNAEAQSKGTSHLKELLAGFDVSRSFGLRCAFLKSGDAASDLIETQNARMKYVKNNVEGIVAYANVIVQLLPDVLIVLLAMWGEIRLSVIGGGGNLFGGISNGFDSLARCRLALAAAGPYFSAITVHDGEEEYRNRQELYPIQQGIVLKNVSFGYGDKPVLENLNLSFERGKKYAVTGPSGSGKSTLLKILLGWLPDYEGTICFDGMDMKNLSPEQLQPQMGYIEQNVFLFHSSIRENITLGGKFSDEEISRALQDSALLGDLAQMADGLDTAVGEAGNLLSGGQKQRVAIARALIHGKSVLLVDEGTSALDQKNADIVEKSLLANSELTLILVSHHLSEQRKAQFDAVYEL